MQCDRVRAQCEGVWCEGGETSVAKLDADRLWSSAAAFQFLVSTLDDGSGPDGQSETDGPGRTYSMLIVTRFIPFVDGLGTEIP